MDMLRLMLLLTGRREIGLRLDVNSVRGEMALFLLQSDVPIQSGLNLIIHGRDVVNTGI